jgi:ribonuclease HI
MPYRTGTSRPRTQRIFKRRIRQPNAMEVVYFYAGCDGNHQTEQRKRRMKMYAWIRGRRYANILSGAGSNQDAAIRAARGTMELCHRMGLTDVLLRSHHEAIVKMINGEYVVKANNLKPHMQEIARLKRLFRRCAAEYVSMEENNAVQT